jgi:hypothetical protein
MSEVHNGGERGEKANLLFVVPPERLSGNQAYVGSLTAKCVFTTAGDVSATPTVDNPNDLFPGLGRLHLLNLGG